ncbi:FliM/FliN family flagellar motor switch protein [Roseovarius atlanticus]|uniref:FliM/FliN family flagellar motor switch protein n=1 Tax=Roseovarius atlanticus TaxID=1641875 RepID=UPI001C96486D|nr:FliM/FliN family flagellar motor switch protein [Roseovarius atlanticus]MBY5988173.1 FliM/FliN family flagellar motor switch protein [Roseovarius atlanticus]MBY6123564.1 FliM/FliN family flagellar motor switch protein [Roseovarius atlanticus]MBY6148059.1 FliM/FliN family flagellar motor switch protein [Roseovarius atlanticus]
MSAEPAESASVIHRKAKVARDEFDAREMSPSKALRLALAKAASAQFELSLVVRMVEHEGVALTGIESLAGEDGLLILLDGLDGPPGAIKLDLQFVMALIEVQLMGEVRQGAAKPRPFTPTDAAIVQPLMNAVLEGYADQVDACDRMPRAARFRFGDRLENGRALALALWAPDYDLYRLNVDFGPGAKTGVMELILPERPPEPEAETNDGTTLARKLEENAMNAPVMLDAVLAPLRLPLKEICGWAPGTLLKLSPETVTGARVIGAKGHKVAPAALGQLNGFRAVRMVLKSEPGDEVAERSDGSGGSAMQEAGGRSSGEGATAQDQTDLPDYPDAPALSDLTDLPDLPGLPDLDDLPDLPDLGEGESDLPELPGLDDARAEHGEEDGALDALVEEELARAAARFEVEGEDDDLPMPGGPSLGAPVT